MSGKTKSRESFELRLLIFSEVSITEEGKEMGSVETAGRWRRLTELVVLLAPPAEGPLLDWGEDREEGVTDRATLVET